MPFPPGHEVYKRGIVQSRHTYGACAGGTTSETFTNSYSQEPPHKLPSYALSGEIVFQISGLFFPPLQLNFGASVFQLWMKPNRRL
jgi:hypothetical protein